MQNSVLPAAFASIALSAGLAAASGSIVIDDFSTDLSAGPLGTFGLPTFSSDTAPLGALGDRTTTLTLNASNPSPQSSTLGILSAGGGLPNRLSFSNGSQQISNSFSITYDSLTQTDFAASISGPGFFEFEVASSDLDDRTTPVFLDASISVNGVTRTVSVSGEGTYSIGFSDFGGVDFSNVTSVGFAFGTESVDAVDISFANLRATPAPSAAALLGIAGLATTRRRR